MYIPLHELLPGELCQMWFSSSVYSITENRVQYHCTVNRVFHAVYLPVSMY